MDSIGYYDKSSKNFHDRTINADVDDLYQKFLAHVPNQGRILDAGCGVGRDSKFFLSKGYEVLPFDGSLEMVKLTSNLLGEDALHMLFQDMNFSSEFDAIWANASFGTIKVASTSKRISEFPSNFLASISINPKSLVVMISAANSEFMAKIIKT